MKHKSVFLITLFAILLFAVGCKKKVSYVNSEKVVQENIFQYYKVSYQSESKQFTVKAVFTVDHQTGDIIRLTDNSKVLFNNDELSVTINETECLYEKKYDGELPATLLFNYTNNNDSTFTNKLILRPFEIKQENIILQKGEENAISFSGMEFGPLESVVCQLMQEGKETIEIEVSPEEKEIIIYREFLDGIQPGNYTGYFIRKNYENDIQAMDRGGLWETEYISTKKQIKIQ